MHVQFRVRSAFRWRLGMHAQTKSSTHTHTHTGQPCESHTLISWVHSHSPPFLLPSSFHSSSSSGLFLTVLCLSNDCLIVFLFSFFSHNTQIKLWKTLTSLSNGKKSVTETCSHSVSENSVNMSNYYETKLSRTQLYANMQ